MNDTFIPHSDDCGAEIDHRKTEQGAEDGQCSDPTACGCQCHKLTALPKCPSCGKQLDEVKIYVKHRHTIAVRLPKTEEEKSHGYPLIGEEMFGADDEFNLTAIESFSHDYGRHHWDAECGYCEEDVTEEIKDNMIAVY